MTWVKLEDGMPEHRKVAGLTDGAFRMNVEAICYCSRQLTDGHVPAAVAKRMHRRSAPLIAELIAAELWHETSGGYEVHDYLEWNRSREEALELQAKRAEAGRRGGRRKQANLLANAKAVAKQTSSKPPSKNVAETDTEVERTTSVVLTAREPARNTNPEWDALEEIFGYRPKGSEAREWGKLCVEIREIGLSRAELHEASRRYDQAMPRIEKTPRALVKHAQRLLAQHGRGALTAADLIDIATGGHDDATGNGGAARGRESRLPEPGGDAGDGAALVALPRRDRAAGRNLGA